MPDDADGYVVAVDAILKGLNDVISKLGGEISISLLVGGSWLTGMVISGRAWFEQVAAQFDGPVTGGPSVNAPAEFADTFRMIGRHVYPADSEVEAGVVEPPDPDRFLYFIHLRDARLLTDQNQQPQEGALVRVRITDVAAWTLGVMGPKGYAPSTPSV